MNEYDDPYKLLASSVVVNHTDGEIRRLLVDDEFVWKHIQKETRNLDLRGAFLDCIVEGMLNGRRMELMTELDKLSVFIYKQLDLERFRSELKKEATTCGVDLEMPTGIEPV